MPPGQRRPPTKHRSQYVLEHASRPARTNRARSDRGAGGARTATVGNATAAALSAIHRDPRVAKHRLFRLARRRHLPDHPLSRSRGTTTTRSACCTRGRTNCGRCAWGRASRTVRATRPPTFETFPFPWPLDTPDAALTDEQRAHRDAIAEAARALDEARRRWLNPPELVREEPDVVPSLPPRLLPVDEDAERELRKRTLTNLYNERPTWLANLHDALDAAVFAAYGWAEAGAPGEFGGGGSAEAAAGAESGAGWIVELAVCYQRPDPPGQGAAPFLCCSRGRQTAGGLQRQTQPQDEDSRFCRVWWAILDSNQWPRRCERRALTI